MDGAALEPLPAWRVARGLAGGLAGCSLVIPTYNRPREVAELLAALARLPDPPEEAVVVDATPQDAAERLLAGWSARTPLPFDLVYVRAPRGLTRQRNAGIDIARGDYVFFLDDDAVPLAGYFSAIHGAFEGDPGTGGVGGAIVNQMDRPLNLRWRVRFAVGLAPRVAPDMYHPSGTSTPRALLKPFAGVRPVDVLPGCAFAFRRAVLDEHRFSEFFQGYSQGEDLEMSLRVGRRWNLVSCGDARVVHNAAPGGRPASYTKGRMEVRNRYFIWKRYSAGAAPADRIRFWADLCFLLAMDLAAFCRWPWRCGALAHGAGVLRAMLGCLARPPRYEEPPARRRYIAVAGT